MHRYWSLNSTLVSLRVIGKLAELCTYDAQTGYVHAIAKSGDETLHIKVDLSTGLVSKGYSLLTEGRASNVANTTAKFYADKGYIFHDNPNKDAIIIDRHPVDNDYVIQLIVAFLTCQVGGEQIAKGLRAKGMFKKNTPKIIHNYIGGWHIILNDNRYVPKDMINSFLPND